MLDSRRTDPLDPVYGVSADSELSRVERLLASGRVEAALQLADRAVGIRTPRLFGLFARHDELDRLVRADALPHPRAAGLTGESMRRVALLLLERSRIDAAEHWIRGSLRDLEVRSTLHTYRRAAQRAGIDGPRFRDILLTETLDHAPKAVFSFHLDSGNLSCAFDVWERTDDWTVDERRAAGDRLLEAAREAGSTELVVAVATAQADAAIERRRRSRYREACEYLYLARDALSTGDAPLGWRAVFDRYEERLARLPALREEAEAAGLRP